MPPPQRRPCHCPSIFLMHQNSTSSNRALSFGPVNLLLNLSEMLRSFSGPDRLPCAPKFRQPSNWVIPNFPHVMSQANFCTLPTKMSLTQNVGKGWYALGQCPRCPTAVQPRAELTSSRGRGGVGLWTLACPPPPPPRPSHTRRRRTSGRSRKEA